MTKASWMLASIFVVAGTIAVAWFGFRDVQSQPINPPLEATAKLQRSREQHSAAQPMAAPEIVEVIDLSVAFDPRPDDSEQAEESESPLVLTVDFPAVPRVMPYADDRGSATQGLLPWCQGVCVELISRLLPLTGSDLPMPVSPHE
jgi:hypothetical protein